MKNIQTFTSNFYLSLFILTLKQSFNHILSLANNLSKDIYFIKNRHVTFIYFII